jgi:tetratricopeptide (TPR) repeat protein
MEMDWNLLDEQWRLRHDARQLASLQNALHGAWRNRDKAAAYSALWRCSRLSHFRAMQAENGDSLNASATAQARRHFAAGAAAALKAVRLQRSRVEGNFWYGVNLIEAARRRTMPAALLALPVAIRHIDRAASIEEEYHCAAPLRVRARLMHLRPLLLGSSLATALAIYRRALRIAPTNSTTLLYYAEALLAARQHHAARNVLKRIGEAESDPDWLWEQTRDRRLATALLQRMNQM